MPRHALVLSWLAAAACSRGAPVGHRLEGALFTPEPLPACESSDAPGRVRCGVESNELLDNPHSGITSFYGFADGLPPSASPRARVAYERFFWDELEPTPGGVRFDLIDDRLEKAHAQGQTFAFRVMAEGETPQQLPQWLADSAGGTWGSHEGGPRSFSPAYDAPAFLEALERTVAALGARYDGDPRLEHVDVGFVGDWGEWAYSLGGGPMPGLDSTRRILDAFVRAFPRTPVVMQIGNVGDDGAPLREAVERSMGWRVDCWGDLGAVWNHHDDLYEQQLERADAGDAWQHNVVAVETCGDTELWSRVGYDLAQVRWLLKWALDHHVSLINNKSRAIPQAWRPSFDEYVRYAGARFFAARSSVEPNGSARIELINRGTAPIYRPYFIALRQRDGEQVVGTVVAAEPLTHVLPGAFSVSLTLPEPRAGLALDVAVVDANGAPAVRLGNAGVRGDGWLEL